MTNKRLCDYLDSIKGCIDCLDLNKIEKIIDVIFDAYNNDKQIFVLGNGGSAATASHFSNDLNKGCTVENKRRFRTIALTDNVSLLTALGNDISYDDIFSEQLANLIKEKDLVIVFSASGNSRNVIKSVELAKKHNTNTIGFLGFDGGKVKDIVDESIIIESNHYGKVEDMHLILTHLISNALRERIANLG